MSLIDSIAHYSDAINGILSDRGMLDRIVAREKVAESLAYGRPSGTAIEPRVVPQSMRFQAGTPVGADEALADMITMFSRVPSGDPDVQVAPPDWGAIFGNRAQNQRQAYESADRAELARVEGINQRMLAQESQRGQLARTGVDAALQELQIREQARQTAMEIGAQGVNAEINAELDVYKLIMQDANEGNKLAQATIRAVNSLTPDPAMRSTVAKEAMAVAKEAGLYGPNGEALATEADVPDIVYEAQRRVLERGRGQPTQDLGQAVTEPGPEPVASPPSSGFDIEGLRPPPDQEGLPAGSEVFMRSAVAPEGSVYNIPYARTPEGEEIPFSKHVFQSPTTQAEIALQKERGVQGVREEFGKRKVDYKRNSDIKTLSATTAQKQLPLLEQAVESQERIIESAETALGALKEGAFLGPGSSVLTQAFSVLSGVGIPVPDRVVRTGVLDTAFTSLAIAKLTDLGGNDTNFELQTARELFGRNQPEEGARWILEAVRKIAWRRKLAAQKKIDAALKGDLGGVFSRGDLRSERTLNLMQELRENADSE